MSQPEFVPNKKTDKPDNPYETPDKWVADRPAEISNAGQPRGSQLGNNGPDQGYALKLAKTFEDKFQLTDGETDHDTVAGCLGVALKRASLFGRAPVVYDLEFAFTLWGFLGGAPDDLIAFRKTLFSSVAHDYNAQREIVDRVNDEAYPLWPNDIRARLHDWTSLIKAELAPRAGKRATAMKLLADMHGTE